MFGSFRSRKVKHFTTKCNVMAVLWEDTNKVTKNWLHSLFLYYSLKCYPSTWRDVIRVVWASFLLLLFKEIVKYGGKTMHSFAGGNGHRFFDLESITRKQSMIFSSGEPSFV